MDLKKNINRIRIGRILPYEKVYHSSGTTGNVKNTALICGS